MASTMDVVDSELECAEREASPNRFPAGYDEPTAASAGAGAAGNGHLDEKADGLAARKKTEGRSGDRASVVSSSSSSGTSVRTAPATRQNTNMSRVSTHPMEMSRIQTARSQQQFTVGRHNIRSRTSAKALPNFGAGKPYPPALPDAEEYVVEFDGKDDPLHPINWPMRRKIVTSANLGFTTLIAVFGSSVFSPATQTVAKQYGVSAEVGILGVSLYVLGFAFGPMIWAPLSELRGRRLPILLGMFGFTIFQICVATAENLQTIMLGRFFGGLFAASPLTVVGAVFSDMFDNRTRGMAITVFSMTVFTGPLMAPFIAGFILENPNLSWRWTEYITAMFGGLAFVIDLIFMRETYAPIILVSKAAELRRRTLNWGIHAKQEEIEVDFRELITKNFSRPIRLLITEPIVFLISLYMAFIYGLLYLSLTSYPIVFEGVHQFSPGIAGLCYFGMIIGELIAAITIILQQPWYNRKLAANGGRPEPEWRLPPAIVGGVAFSGGLFWFGWTGFSPDIPWIVPTLSGLLLGFGLLSIFLQSLNYIIDAYLMFAASAIAANTLLRSIFGAVFPLFATYMYEGLGIQWAGTLLGCVAALLAPIPFVFWKFGAKIRERSKIAPTFPKPEPPSEGGHDA